MNVKKSLFFLRTVIIFLCIVITGIYNLVSVEAAVKITLESPYFLEEKNNISQGDIFQTRIIVEANEPYTLANKKLTVFLPQGISPYNLDESWVNTELQDGKCVLTKEITLKAGYGQWFDLLSLKVDKITEGSYSLKANLEELAAVSSQIDIVTNNKFAKYNSREVVIEKVELPLNKDGKKDSRLQDKSLVLRDEKLDYVRNILQGKGASNIQSEAVHPLTHIGIDILNKAAIEKVIIINAVLLDYKTKELVPGLVTPATTGEDAYSSIFNQEGSQAMGVLSGNIKQRLIMPIYVNEKLLTSDRYWLQVSLRDGDKQIVSFETPIFILKKNYTALIITSSAIAIIILAVYFLGSPMRKNLAAMKTRWLITIALFSTTTFATVNVPSSLIGDFFHILLGPFSFLITGLFTGVIFYMLLISLLMLIPYSGVITLYMIIRLLLSIFAFGHLSILTIFSYSLQALCLEAGFIFFRYHFQKTSEINQFLTKPQNVIPLALIFAVLDACTTYVNLQAATIFYRLYYADWYIYLVLFFNGFLFTAIGVFCGSILGRQVKKIKGD